MANTEDKVRSVNEATNRPKAFSYIRMSTREQLEGDSFRRQEEKSLQYAEQHELDLVLGYKDIGISAFRGANSAQGALADFRKAVSDGHVPRGSYLIIESMDRLTRQMPLDAFGVLSEIINQGIVIVTLDDGQKYSADSFATNHFQLFMAIGSMIRSHEESKRKAGLSLDNWSQKRKLLREEGKVLTARVPSWLRLDEHTGEIVTIPERVEVVKEVFELTRSGWGVYAIAAMFNKRGEPPWGGTQATRVRAKNSDRALPVWRSSYLKKVLDSRAVLGEFQPHTHHVSKNHKRVRIPEGEPIRDYYPAIISEQEFLEAAAATARRRTGARGRKGRTYSNLFSGILHCGQCGARMRMIDKGKGKKYLLCSAALENGGCIRRSYKYDHVERILLQYLEELDVRSVLDRDELEAKSASVQDEIDRLNLELADLQALISVRMHLLDDSTVSSPKALLAQMRNYEERKERISQELEEKRALQADLRTTDPEVRQVEISRLLAAIRQEEDDDARLRARYGIANEIQRLITSIVVSHRSVYGSEADEDYDPSKKLSPELLADDVEANNFVLDVRYRHGAKQLIDLIDKTNIKLPYSQKMDALKIRVMRRKQEALSVEEEQTSGP